MFLPMFVKTGKLIQKLKLELAGHCDLVSVLFERKVG